jgi:hypothetical protein
MKRLLFGLCLAVMAIGVPVHARQAPMLRDTLMRVPQSPLVALPADKALRLYVDDEGEPVIWKVVPQSFGSIAPDPDVPRVAVFTPFRARGTGTVWVKVGTHPWRVLSVTIVDVWVRGHLHPGEQIPK